MQQTRLQEQLSSVWSYSGNSLSNRNERLQEPVASYSGEVLFIMYTQPFPFLQAPDNSFYEYNNNNNNNNFILRG